MIGTKDCFPNNPIVPEAETGKNKARYFLWDQSWYILFDLATFK